jgi:hypothetical protein
MKPTSSISIEKSVLYNTHTYIIPYRSGGQTMKASDKTGITVGETIFNLLAPEFYI